MERNERTRLHSIRRQLKASLSTVDTLLRTATAPKRVTRKQARERALKIVAAVKAERGKVSREQLRDICSKHGMPFTSVGALFQGGYLKRQGKGHVAAGYPRVRKRRQVR